MKKLCASRRFSFVFGCGLSACAGNLLKFFLSLLQKLTDAGNLVNERKLRYAHVGCEGYHKKWNLLLEEYYEGLWVRIAHSA